MQTNGSLSGTNEAAKHWEEVVGLDMREELLLYRVLL